MGQSTTPLRLDYDAEPIPGYFLRNRIGAGGYGEVWMADAPGGLNKAIKFVYGHLDDARAARELKSLNRIKEVHHPFLLSIERIEVIDGHLLIVTELAQSSLKDRFDECREAGMPGIPRDELLVYLRDAADALDYIYEEYSLQHLDVKPENLLLVANRVKVGDFGLLKDLHDTSASLMGGLTPTYAPPEVFDGRPNRHSDQYSLAIVAQEMLTGELPFAGRTAAQLAAQHLHSRPVLASLPTEDKPTIAKALSKDPDQRFASCREFVDRLMRPEQPQEVESRASKSQRPLPTAGSRTQPLPSGNGSSAPMRTRVLGNNGEQAGAANLGGSRDEISREVSSLPPLELPDEKTKYRPTLFLGIGSTGARTLRRLRRRLHQRFGDLQHVPALQMLLVDTNVKDINRAVQGDAASALCVGETVAMPLRRPKDYRAASKDLLKWMSRRWLYNIPRSLLTEGLRPLGRLAFVDHAEQLLQRLRVAVSSMTDLEAIAESSERTGIEFCDEVPRVFVIASISGGTGGGMVLDVAYAARKVLQDLGLSDEDLCGILTHSTDRKASTRDLAIANAYATLTELFHYSHPGGFYPGDPVCNLPAFHEGNRTFRDAYLVHLGDEQTEEEFDESTDILAEYLYRSSVTSASAAFDRCRTLDPDQQDGAFSNLKLRTFGLCQLGGTEEDGNSEEMEEALCRALVYRWRGAKQKGQNGSWQLPDPEALILGDEPVPDVSEDNVQRLVAEHSEAHGIVTIDSLLREASEIIDGELSADPDEYFTAVLNRLHADYQAQHPEERRQQPKGQTLEALESLLGSPKERRVSSSAGKSLQQMLDARLEARAAKLGAAGNEWILELAGKSAAQMRVAQRVGSRYVGHLRELEKKTAEVIARLQKEVVDLKQEMLDWKTAGSQHAQGNGDDGPGIDSRLLKYGRLRLHEVTLHGVCGILKSVVCQITNVLDQLRDHWKDRSYWAGKMDVPAEPFESHLANSAHSEGVSDIREALLLRKEELLRALDQEMESRLFSSEERLRHVLTDGAGARHAMTTVLRSATRTVVLRTIKEISRTRQSTISALEPASADDRLRTQLELATPGLIGCGGAKRLLIMMPEGTNLQKWRDDVQRLSGEECTIVSDADGDAVLCYEMEQIVLEEAAGWLADYRNDYPQIAARIHTRVDVDWLPL